MPSRIREVLSSHVASGDVPGLVGMVSRLGEVEVIVEGRRSLEGQDPLRRDDIFRISSMSKPVGAVAALILVEEGVLRLDDPVERFLPELADRRVLVRPDGPLSDTVPAKRSITLRDLLTMRMGFGIQWGLQDTPIQRAEAELHLGAFGPPRPLIPPEPDEWMRRFTSLPLMHQPGERWAYNTPSEVLGVLIARASGQGLEAFLRRRIFEPLEMKDTGFSVPAEQLPRLPVSYVARNPFEPDGSPLDIYDPPQGGHWSRPPAFPSLGAGLVSTADDFLAFASMLLKGGSHRGTRILSAASVEAMTRDQLTPQQKTLSPFGSEGYWTTNGWGFNVNIVTQPDELAGAAGRYGWDRGLGTTWANDPGRGLIGILMTQRCAFPLSTGLYRDFWRGLYA